MAFKVVIFAAFLLCSLAAIVSPRPSTRNSKHVQQSTEDSLSWLWKPSTVNSTNVTLETEADYTGDLTRRPRRDTPNPCMVANSGRLSKNGYIVVSCHTRTLVGCSSRYNGGCRPVRCHDGSDLLTIECECETAANPVVKACRKNSN